jgi:hypothetical protein
MNENSLANLKPWTKGASGNPAGRKHGSKNTATLFRELLEQEIDPDLFSTSNLAVLTSGKPKTYAEALTLTLFVKALEGNVQALRLVFETISKKNTSVPKQQLLITRKLQNTTT